MNTKLKPLVTVTALLTLHAAAQTAEPDTSDIDAAIDEVTVIGARTLAKIRAEVIMAEDEVYALFNDLNDDDGYDIICKKETRIGSQIPYRVCLARMYRDALSEATEDGDAEYGTVGAKLSGKKHQKILRDKMRALAIEHPELLAALKKRYVAEKEFQEERDRKYGN
jgi:hypothetical protein